MKSDSSFGRSISRLGWILSLIYEDEYLSGILHYEALHGDCIDDDGIVICL